MVTAIQPRAAPTEPPVTRPVGAVAVEKAAPEATEAKKLAIKPPVKAPIKVDTESMRENLQEAITRINEMMRDGGRGLNFSLDERLGRPIVMVRNLESGEVIRQIPNEVVVKVAHSIEDLKGMLHNETV